MALLAIDLTNKQTLDQLQRVFIPLLEEQASSCMIVVVGTKLDLVKSKGREIGASEGRALAESQHQKHLAKALESNPNTFLQKIDPKELYFETSAKTGDGVSTMFGCVERILLGQLKQSSNSATGSAGGASGKARAGSRLGKPAENTISLDDERPPSERQGQCCKS